MNRIFHNKVMPDNPHAGPDVPDNPHAGPDVCLPPAKATYGSGCGALTTTTQFCPPKPKAVLIAVRTGAWRATFGT
jgi:hypothetical protein